MQASRPASTSTRPPVSPLPRQNQINTQTKVLDTTHGRILCIADIRGRLSALNDLAREASAKAIIHTGDFGFFESDSVESITDRTLRHLTMYSPLIPSSQRVYLLAPENSPAVIRSAVNISLLSEFPLLLSGQIKLSVPVYTVWGACEDVHVLEKFRQGTYNIENLHVLDEATTRCIDVGGVKLRLLGLGGALVPHKLFDNGRGKATIAGANGTMWTTALQIGELVDTAQRVFDPTETRLFVSHASPGREGIIAQLALVLKADLTISAGLHFRYATSYNEFSVQGDFEGFRRKLGLGKEGFDQIWESVKQQVEDVIDDNQKVLLDKALSVVERLPPIQPSTGPGATATGEEPAWKNCWNWNLCDAAFGTLVLDVKEGRISAELKSQGFNYAYRRTATTQPTPNAPNVTLPNSSQPSTKRTTPAPSVDRPPPYTPTAPSVSMNDITQSPTQASASVPAPASASGTASPAPKVNGGTPSSEKAEREKAKKKEKKERKERERTEREKAADNNKEKDASAGPAAEEATSTSTPDPAVGIGSTSVPPSDTAGPKSPVTETGSSGVRTPKSNKSQRNPWTIFMRMPSALTNVSEAEVKEFFGEAKDKIMKIHWPTHHPGRAKLAYVEFEDEESMKAGLEKHVEKLQDTVIEVKQATDRESRGGDSSFRGGSGRGGHSHGHGHRGRGGAYAARGFAAAGLTRGGFRGNQHNNNSGSGAGGGGDGAQSSASAGADNSVPAS